MGSTLSSGLAWVMNSYKVQSRLQTVVGVETTERVAALTFDDGPDPTWTPRILDCLAQYGAKATFFLVGRNVRTWPQIVRRIVAEGHAVGNHTFTHPCLVSCSPRRVMHELGRCQTAIHDAAGLKTTLMRPPYGSQNVATYVMARSLGYRVIHWSAAGHDWLGATAAGLIARITRELKPGGILLLHDRLEPRPTGPDAGALADRRATIQALFQLLTADVGRFQFVTIPELLACGPVRRRIWFEECPQPVAVHEDYGFQESSSGNDLYDADDPR
jgi:peptidoglycan/xylan/chitin deacetylase (PgdA/CDA1 family)